MTNTQAEALLKRSLEIMRKMVRDGELSRESIISFEGIVNVAHLLNQPYRGEKK